MGWQVAEETNLRMEDSLAVWTGDGSLMFFQGVGSWLLTFWLASVVLLQQFCLPHRLQRLCTGRSATQHGPEQCVPMCWG